MKTPLIPRLVWNPLPTDLEGLYQKLSLTLNSWKNTPYLEGSCTRQGGVDCVRFVCSVVDEFFGFKDIRIPKIELPTDACFHDKERCFSAMRILKTYYDPLEEISFALIEPGDLIVTGPKKGGPGHLMIVGPEKNTLWHTSKDIGVCKTGLAAPYKHTVFRAWRFSERSKWLYK